MAALVPFVPDVMTCALMHPTEVVGTPFNLSNHDYGHSNNSKMPMAAPALDVMMVMILFHSSTHMMSPMSPFIPGVPTCGPMHPTEAVVATPFGLFNEDYSHSNNSKMPMTVPTLDGTIEMALSYPLPLMMAATSPFIPGVPTSPPILDPMVALSR
jgi:hypothetical protein